MQLLTTIKNISQLKDLLLMRKSEPGVNRRERDYVGGGQPLTELHSCIEMLLF